MRYSETYNRSTFRSGRSCTVSSEGSVRSNDIEISKSISYDLADCIRHNNELAYEAHTQSRGG
jgi:hypothetical protein